MSDDDSRRHLLARVECAVRGGFEDEEELLEELEQWVEDELGESDSALVETLDAHARKLFQAQRVREAGWSEPTLNDALDSAFEELNGRGIVALDHQDTPPRGAVFFHGQDLERGVAGQGLMLAFGAYEEDAARGRAWRSKQRQQGADDAEAEKRQPESMTRRWFTPPAAWPRRSSPGPTAPSSRCT